MRKITSSLILAIIVIGLVLSSHSIYANPLEENFIRIRLTSPIKSNGIVNLYSDEGFYIYSKANLIQEIESIDIENIKVSIGEEERLYIMDVDDNLLYAYNQEDDLIISSKGGYEKKVRVEDKNYRDYINFKIMGANLIVINYVDIDNYLYGVVPKEMPVSFEMEALKAQAIAARTYALKHMNKHNNECYDLCDTTHCQVYGGMDGEDEKTNRAVDGTSGMIITYNGNIIDALYHSNSGGVTEDSLEAWGNSHPYLISVEDEFSINAPNGSWSLNLNADEISKSLKNKGVNIGNVIDMEVLGNSSSGRVTQLKIIGTLGEKILNKGQIREFLGLTEVKSNLFTIKKSSNDATSTNLYAIDGNSSKLQLIDLETSHIIDGSTKQRPSRGLTSRFINRDGVVDKIDGGNTGITNFIIEGKGYGHGVGMSQWGAQKMAESGYTFEDILKHYYNGVEIIKN
ncbi:putative SpoIID/LytB domain protein [[Clostridium] ultunense Esp]|uniref:Putative SpoIID/LytB domain protein n=1 Tax=[Clostridium] ultunense Esp TaxID=1288971 RepID=M1Z8U8_9FIRM|nr:putative SpoIID/LytB domain protein [[Clostridium] ultunense Esp]SHD76887.1 putative SpoIID/LytB domain protein [[Clostridium] ultunense Esp]